MGYTCKISMENEKIKGYVHPKKYIDSDEFVIKLNYNKPVFTDEDERKLENNIENEPFLIRVNQGVVIWHLLVLVKRLFQGQAISGLI